MLEKFGLPGKLLAMIMYNLIHIIDLQESTCKPNENVSAFFSSVLSVTLIICVYIISSPDSVCKLEEL